ncbi:MAG: hypothetical protein R6X18_16310, partial [Chloroflexota bacterium]
NIWARLIRRTFPLPLLTMVVNVTRSSFVKVTLYLFAGISSSYVFGGRMPLFNSSGKLCLSNY